MTVLTCDQLFDGVDVRGPSRIETDGQTITRIVAVDASAPRDPAIPHYAAIVPGLVDAHVHITGMTEGMPAGNPFEKHKHFARTCVFSGVTTVRDLGNSLEALAYISEWSDRYRGPRVVGAGPLLDQPPLTWSFTRLVRSQREAEHHVAQLSREGVAWLKVYFGATAEATRWIARAAADHDLPVAIHCGHVRPSEASAAGVRSVEHAGSLLPDLVEDDGPQPFDPVGVVRRWSQVDPGGDAAKRLRDQFGERGTWLCPTLLVTRRWALMDEMLGSPFLRYAAVVMPYHHYLMQMQGPIGTRIGKRYMKKYMPVADLGPQERQEVNRGLANLGELVCFLADSGVRVVAGSDTPNPSLAPGFSLHEELALLQQAGLSPLDTLRAATGWAGELLGAEGVGRLAAGSAADLLCLREDPTGDVNALGSIERVMVRGEWVDRDRIRDMLEDAIERGRDRWS